MCKKKEYAVRIPTRAAEFPFPRDPMQKKKITVAIVLNNARPSHNTGQPGRHQTTPVGGPVHYSALRVPHATGSVAS